MVISNLVSSRKRSVGDVQRSVKRKKEAHVHAMEIADSKYQDPEGAFELDAR